VPDANGKNVSLDAIQALLGELAAVTTDEFFHLGGDEVAQDCWANTPAVQSWMKAHGIATTDGVYEYFVQAVDTMTLNLGKSPVRWEEVWKHFTTDLDKRTVIHAWLSKDALVQATSLGYRAIWSVDGLYYLDALNEVWESFYDVDILAGVKNASALPLVLGGEAAQWGEEADGSDVLQTIWPRAAAIAERLWSYNMALNASDETVAARLAGFRCLLLARGVPATPLNSLVARSPPSGPGSCLTQ
jgi:hexosaminidase